MRTQGKGWPVEPLPRWPANRYSEILSSFRAKPPNGPTGQPVYSCRKPKALQYNCQQTWIAIFPPDFLILLTSAKTGVNEAAQGKCC